MKVLARLRQLVKLVAQDLAMIPATWHRRYQTGGARVIYNFAREIIGLKNHGGVAACQPVLSGRAGPSLGRSGQDRLPALFLFFFGFFFQRAHAAVVHFVSLGEK